jgi:hypothetical protein
MSNARVRGTFRLFSLVHSECVLAFQSCCLVPVDHLEDLLFPPKQSTALGLSTPQELLVAVLLSHANNVRYFIQSAF